MKSSSLHSLTEFPVPDSRELESIVLCEIATDNNILPLARKLLSAEDFSKETAEVWNSICAQDDKFEEIDIITLSQTVSAPVYNSVILPYIGKATGINSERYIYLLRDASCRRKAYFAAIEALKSIANPSIAIADVMSKVGGIVDGIANGSKSKRSQSLGDAITDLADSIEKKDRRVPTGIPSLDKLTYGGFNEGNLVILAARPSVGKTATALYMMQMAARQRKSVFMASLEMTNQELAQRYLFSTELLRPVDVATKKVNWEDFEKATAQFDGLKIFINDEVKSIDEICAEIKTQVRLNNIDIAYIDYLGLIRSNGPIGEPLAMALGRVTSRLKDLAKELHIPIVLLCQLNRGSAIDKRTPQLFDLRDSGAIEQDADIVLMLNKPEVPFSAEEGEYAGRLDMWIRKNRNGRRDIGIAMEHNPTHTMYREIDTITE